MAESGTRTASVVDQGNNNWHDGQRFADEIACDLARFRVVTKA